MARLPWEFVYDRRGLDIPAGTVLEQSPAPGERLEPGGEVALVVSEPPPAETTPPPEATPTPEPAEEMALGGRRAGWTLRAAAALAQPAGEDRSQAGLALASSSGPGLVVGLERRFTSRLGLDLGLVAARVDSAARAGAGRAADRLGLLALTAGPTLHLWPAARADVYAGPLVGWARLDDATYGLPGGTTGLDFDQELIWGGQVGVDLPLGSGRWALHARATYLDAAFDASGAPSLDLDPLIVAVGVAYGF